MSAFEYRCIDCGNTSRFRAEADAKVKVIVDGDGKILEAYLEHQIINSQEISIVKVTDCMECGGINIEKSERKGDSESE